MPALAKQRLQLVAGEYVVGSRGAADDDVDRLEFLFPRVKPDGSTFELLGQRDGLVVGTIGDEHTAGASAFECARRFFAHVAGADDEHLLRLERVKNRFSQLDRNRADRDAAPLNLRPGSDELGHVKRLLKGLVEQRPGGLLGERELVGLLELAKDFGLAQHH